MDKFFYSKRLIYYSNDLLIIAEHVIKIIDILYEIRSLL